MSKLSIIAPYIYTMPVPILSTTAIFVMIYYYLSLDFCTQFVVQKSILSIFLKLQNFPTTVVHVSETSDHHQLQS